MTERKKYLHVKGNRKNMEVRVQFSKFEYGKYPFIKDKRENTVAGWW